MTRQEWDDMCQPWYLSIEKVFAANNYKLNCKGCGAPIQGGHGWCRYCDRRYGT